MKKCTVLFSRAPQPWQGGKLPSLQVSAYQSVFLSGEWGLNRLLSGYWITTLTTEPRPPQIQMYEKNTHTNVWKKQAYKCMKKTRIQTRIQMYDKNAYKHAYKCMKKTGIQMYEKNTHTNVWKKPAYKCMKKNPHTNVWQKRIQKRIQTRIQMYEKDRHTNVWKKHAYKCMKKNTHTNVWKKYTYILERSITAAREHGGTMPFSRAPQPWQGGKLPSLQVSAYQSVFWVVSGDWTAYPLVIG